MSDSKRLLWEDSIYTLRSTLSNPDMFMLTRADQRGCIFVLSAKDIVEIYNAACPYAELELLGKIMESLREIAEMIEDIKNKAEKDEDDNSPCINPA